MNLSKRRLAVLWAGIVVVAAMCLFPPWRESVSAKGVRASVPRGYAVVFRAPRPATYDEGYATVAIDAVRLTVQCLVVALLTGGLLVTVGGKKADLDSQPPAP